MSPSRPVNTSDTQQRMVRVLLHDAGVMAAPSQFGTVVHIPDDAMFLSVTNTAAASSVDRNARPAESLSARFRRLKREWQSETAGTSILSRRFRHHAYRKIIAMGIPAVPFLLDEVKNRTDWWFMALRSITREDPTHPGDSYDAARDAWLRWGEVKGYSQ